MKRHQFDYCMERIDAIRRRKEKELEEKHTLVPEKRLSDAEKRVLVERLCPLPVISTYHLVRGFNFSAHEQERVLDEDALKKALATLEREMENVRGRLVLGDATEALESLEKFDAMPV